MLSLRPPSLIQIDARFSSRLTRYSFRRDGQMTFYALDGTEVQSILMTLHLLYGRDKSSAAAIPSPRPGRPMEADPSD
jgi:hypothetical protein